MLRFSGWDECKIENDLLSPKYPRTKQKNMLPTDKKNMLVNNHEMIEYAKIFPYDWFYRDRAKFKIINHIRWSERFEFTSFQGRDTKLCRYIFRQKNGNDKMISKILKFSAFNLEFQNFFSITRTIFSHSRSEQFW